MDKLYVGIWFLISKDLLKEPDENKRNQLLVCFVQNKLKDFSPTSLRVGEIKTHLAHRLVKKKKGAFERRDMDELLSTKDQEIINFVAEIERSQLELMTKHPLVVFVDQSMDADYFG